MPSPRPRQLEPFPLDLSGQAGIFVRVHSVLREPLRFGDISVPGQVRMDNLLKVHNEFPLPRLSMMTMSPGFRVGSRIFST